MCTASVCAVKHMQRYNKLIEVGYFYSSVIWFWLKIACG